MRHTLIRRFTTDTHKLRRKDADGEDPDERLVPLDRPLAAVDLLTDALQHTQEKRATPGQEDFGILESMNPLNGSSLPKVLSTLYYQQALDSGLIFPSHLSNLSQWSRPFHLISTISLYRRQLITTSHRKDTLFHFRSRSLRVG